MLDFVFYQKVKVMYGPGYLNKTGELLTQAGYNKAFIVCDAGIVATGMVKKLSEVLDASHINYVVFDKVQPNPPIKFVVEGAELCKKESCDCVIGIGGGSNIDTAKAINCLRFNSPPIERFADPNEPMNNSPGLIIIPTTSGTGSEVSDGMILSDENHNKVPMLATNCMSEYAILDPELTAGMPKKLTIFTGLDALSHCVEAYTSNCCNPFNYPILEKMMDVIIEYLPRAVENGKDMEARGMMCIASCIGGWMLGTGHCVAGHSFGHIVGGLFEMPHGLAVFSGLPYVLEFNAPVIPEQTKKVAQHFGITFKGDETPEQIGTMARDGLINFRDNVLHCPSIKTYPHDDSRFEELAKDIEGEMFQVFNPRKMTAADALEILKKVYA